ncbi:MAG: RNB domain-containing ribonuclease, partial [Actinobacteria bacterium]|nr:RNB domain-containing ribonuclease [Actinomycetota bacterium]
PNRPSVESRDRSGSGAQLPRIMTFRRVRIAPNATDLKAGFERIRRAMQLPTSFPPDVEAEAESASRRSPSQNDRVDALGIDLLTIDPPGSRDLDQAFHAEKDGSHYRVHYAISDVGAFVEPGGPLDRESWKRGQTLYSPDSRVGLYPPELGEGGASLLANEARPAVLWTIDLDEGGTPLAVDVQRATVRSRRQMTYEEAQGEIGSVPSLTLLEEIGTLRLEAQRKRGGLNLEVPEQEVERTPRGYELRYRVPLPVEEWNAQISLLTGMAAAQIMLDGKVGLLRTMPAPEPEVITQLRRHATALGIAWPAGARYPEVVGSLDPARPAEAALLTQATRLFRGAGYTFFDGEVPAQSEHHALATPYAHVTAPLRRLADRYANEVVLSLCRGGRPPQWTLDALPDLPEVMKEAHRKDGELERRIVDFVEAAALSTRVGDVFEGVVVQEGAKSTTIQLDDPAVIARCDKACGSLGASVKVRVSEADPEAGRVTFEPLT